MIGIDIVEISRLKALIKDRGFLDKVYTDEEIEYCGSAKSDHLKASRFANRFAAKEAIFKAVDKLDALYWKEIQILNEPSGKPVVTFSGKTKKVMQENKLNIELSLSHSRQFAVAAAMCVRG
ncbi:MAG: holo-ACP synthase [Candidatus Margulisbacteria bacterium]|nr:holo-ACP synthase [Candidatus Margulisiibacteriota bacterium]